jgi:hypothetical protein
MKTNQQTDEFTQWLHSEAPSHNKGNEAEGLWYLSRVVDALERIAAATEMRAMLDEPCDNCGGCGDDPCDCV